MENILDVIGNESVAQLTRLIAGGVRTTIPRGLANRVLSSEVIEYVSRHMANDVMIVVFNEFVSEGMASGVRNVGASSYGNTDAPSNLVGGFVEFSGDVVGGSRRSSFHRSISELRGGSVGLPEFSGVSNEGGDVVVTESTGVSSMGGGSVYGGFGGGTDNLSNGDLAEVVSLSVGNAIGVSGNVESADAMTDATVVSGAANGISENGFVNVSATGMSTADVGARIDGRGSFGYDGTGNEGGVAMGPILVNIHGELDRDRLLGWFNQEEIEDVGRVRTYHAVARGLKVVVRRRRDRMRRLGFIRGSPEVAMQLEDVEKGTRVLLMMCETEVKIGEKAAFILNLRRGYVE